ncbi:hypothetical protein ACFPM3_20310 [Streptomyces coeruleoprunus]|uniref:Uncharacterized protein n=1 Tax=Streptomyces coeruleoprunus TaxID=285563 RepID=A0ABV9XGQ8_9ACTN
MSDTETPNERNAHQHIRIGLALLLEDREHPHSREDIAAFLNAELDHALGDAA